MGRGALAATVGVMVLVAGLASDASAAEPRPSVRSLSVKLGSTSGGLRITVTGTHFTRVRRVEFGKIKGGHIRVVSPRKLLVTTPKHPGGLVNLRVVTAAGTSPSVARDRFRFVPPPRVTKIAPQFGKGAGGVRIGVTGRHFTRVRKVEFGTARGTSVKVVSASKLSVVAPKHAVGRVAVRVITAFGASKPVNAAHFSYVPTWSADTLLGFDFRALSCVSPTFCVGIGARDEHDNWEDHSAITYNGSTWSGPVRIDPDHLLTSVSCVSVSFCVAVDDDGEALTYDGSTWSASKTITPDSLTSVSCVSASFCVAVNGEPDPIAFSYNGASWQTEDDIAPFDEAGDGFFTSVSCGSASFCVAVDNEGQAYIRRADGTWSNPNTIDPGEFPGNDLTSVSCVSATFCSAVDDVGQAVTYHGKRWSFPVRIDSNYLYSVSCVSASFCVAVDMNGENTNSRALTYNGEAWSPPTVITPRPPNLTEPAVSCVAGPQCVAVGFRDSAIGK